MARAGVRPADLVAVASIGGGAVIPAITTTLSEHLRVPVVTTPRPALTAAIGAALRAARGPADDSATALAPAAVAVAPVAAAVIAEPAMATGRALAWSEASDVPELAPVRAHYADPPVEHVGLTSARPQLDFEPDPVERSETAPSWYRRPIPVVAAALLVIAVAGAGTAFALRNDSTATPAAPTPSISTTPQAAPPPAEPAEPTTAPVQDQAVQANQPPPATRTVVQAPAPVVQTQVIQAPAVTTEAPPPPPVTQTETSTATVTSTEVSTVPPTTEAPTAAPTTQQAPRLIPTIPPIPTIPGLPAFIPQLQVQPQASG